MESGWSGEVAVSGDGLGMVRPMSLTGVVGPGRGTAEWGFFGTEEDWA